MLENLLTDSEAVIRQHVAAQLVPLSVVAIQRKSGKLQDYLDDPSLHKQKYDKDGVKSIQKYTLKYLETFLQDPEVDVRRAAADALATLNLHWASAVPHALEVAQRLVDENPPTGVKAPDGAKKKRTEAEQRSEELRVTSCNMYAELGGAVGESLKEEPPEWIHETVLPALLKLCSDESFRVRRAATQALPRVLGACTAEDAAKQLLPAFEKLSQDEIHRVRKSSGECLVDMSRALIMVAERTKDANLRKLRTSTLLPIADRLIQDSHKQVRQGMMQFLGPFMASFYPYQSSALHALLPTSVESDGSHHRGIVAQFFPHASSMVARLNSSQSAITKTPTPVSLDVLKLKEKVQSESSLYKLLPAFLHASRLSSLSLAAVVHDRTNHPPDSADLQSLSDVLLDYFAALSVVSTGDENTDAEMRVYCAYSFPALVLLLGPENWEGSMRTCFFTLLNPAYGQEDSGKETEAVEPPLPVKRCLASSLHTVAHILGPEIATRDVVPTVKDYFLPYADESVRLNMIRNFGSLLAVLPVEQRKSLFVAWSEIVQGESFLGGRKRSASNPLVLNWRQRSYLARSIPDLIGLLSPTVVHEHIWPILKILLTDCVNDVREDALWSIAMLLRAYCEATITATKWPSEEQVKIPKKFSKEKSHEVIDWIVNHILSAPSNHNTGKTRPSNFTDRQVYCRVCGTIGLALRLSESAGSKSTDPVEELTTKMKKLFLGKNKPEAVLLSGPYQQMTSAEQGHVKKLLREEMLPAILEMKEDCTSNVRITLMKVLQIMPTDIRSADDVKPVLQALEEEHETWTSFGEEPQEQAKSSSTPVDVDNVTPDASEDEAAYTKNSNKNGSEEILKTVEFEDGPIGMQLEPTEDDKACRVHGFNDLGGGKAPPAVASGKVAIGDVIVSVNGKEVTSYDATIDLLKQGGRRVVVFRGEKKRPSSKKGKKKSEDNDSDNESKRSTKSSKSSKSRKSKKSSSTKKMDKIDESEEVPKTRKKIKKESKVKTKY